MKSLRYAALTAVVILIAGVTPAQDALHVADDGQVGVGTTAPEVPLHIVTTAAPNNTVLQIENNGPARLRIKNNTNGVTVSEFLLDVNGNLTISGTLTAGNPPQNFPDYVFEDDYKLMSLDELGKYVKENRHLPNIPSANQVAAEGKLNISEFQYRLLEKIEELTLYTLQQQQNIAAQQQNIAELRSQIEDLQQRAAN